MFKSKSNGDIERLAKKFVNIKKTNSDRIKYLKLLIEGDGFVVDDLKAFFEQHYQHVYHVFYDIFSHVEQERKVKGQRAHKDDFEFLLILFEKILTLLPHMIQRRWQFHSIRRLMKQLLHAGNTLKIRKDGVRLFIIWYQILQNNNDRENHEIFSKLVSLFSDDEAYFMFSDTLAIPTSEAPVTPNEILPLVTTQSSEKSSHKVHKFLMESVLTFMVSEVVKIQWLDIAMQELAFRFVFTSFKTYYLNLIFPNFDVSTSVYAANIDQLPEFGVDVTTSSVNVLEDCQDVVIRWFTTFVQASRHPQENPEENNIASSDPALIDEAATTFYLEETNTADVSDLEGVEGGTLTQGDSSTLDSQTGTLTNGSLEHSASSGLSIDEANLYLSQHDIVYKVLLGDRDNINIVHEIFRQAFMLPLTHAGAVRRVVLVYKDWLQVPDTRPKFMLEPITNSTNSRTSSFDETDLVISSASRQMKSTSSMSEALTQEEVIKAGLQNSLLLFIKHSAFVFMINPSKESLSMQVDLCRRVLNIYRYMVMNIELDNKTWEQLLVVLLKVTSYVLGQDDALLGKHLAASLFQTLIVSWIKANLCIHMSQSLWDQLLSVLSSLSHWQELIKEWAKTMETLTRVLAKQVYKLNLSDLPLDRLSEQKAKRNRGKMPPVTRVLSKKGTFSRAYSRFDSATAFRAQLLTRSVTQDSDNTIIDEDHSETEDDVTGVKTSNSSAGISRGRSISEALQPVGLPLKRSTSDSNLFGSMDKLKIGSTATLVDESLDNDTDTVDGQDGGTLKSANQEPEDPSEEVTGRDESNSNNIERDEHIPMSFSEESSPTKNLNKHSTTTPAIKTQPSTPIHDDSIVSAYEHGIYSRPRSSSTSRRSKPVNGPDALGNDTVTSQQNGGSPRRNGRLSSESGGSIVSESVVSVSESDMSEDTNSMISMNSEFSETLTTPTPSEGQRSHSSSPTSNDLSSYLPEDMASFLKQDSVVTSNYDTESLRHSGSIDKDNIAIDEMSLASKSEVGTDYRSVLTGGQIPGWTPDVAVVLWRRMLGVLGDVNEIKQPSVHEKVMGHLLELQDTLLKLSDNLNVSADNTYSQEPGDLCSPVFYFFSVCFKCMSLGPEFLSSKVISLQMLAKMCLRFDYQIMSPVILARFYQLLHKALMSGEQRIVDTLVRHCTPLLFGLDLPGGNLFILDVLNAAHSVLSLDTIKMVPRREAITLLGTMVCFPNHFGAIEVLTQGTRRNEMEPDQLKEMVLAVLLDAGRKEPAGLARCVALSSLGIFLVEEILSGEKHPKFREAVNVLLVSLRFNTKLVAWVACDMLLLLSDFVPELEEYEAGLPVKIVSTIVNTFHNHVFSLTNLDDNLVVAIMFCLLRWCMNLPLHQLTKKDENGKCVIGKVLKILEVISAGVDKTTPYNNPGLSQEYDLESMMSVAVCTNSPVKSLNRTDAFDQSAYEQTSVSSAAKFVMRHLVNLISHFPANSVPTHTYTSLQECHNLLPADAADKPEMTKEIFDSPNLQMFVYNRSTLISVMEMEKRDMTCPIESTMIPKSSARVLIRDLTGRYSFSGTMVYETRKAGPTTIKRSFSQTSITESMFDSQSNTDLGSIASVMAHPLPPSDDPLDKILRHIADSSPECQLQPGEPLDIPCHSIDDVTSSLEEQVKVTSANHEQVEMGVQAEQKGDFRLKVSRERSAPYMPSTIPYTVCRQLLNQLGYLSWDTRQKYELLNKNEKLLREIKHLDTQNCRETHKFAVVYVGYGQEDKQSILSNPNGSAKFERFVSGLGWEVDLATHEGFIGGLQRNGSNGATAPYYCTSTLEVMYHVSTRMPAESDDERHKKLRHIGNDEVHIVWSEHYRPYRRGIIPTEFGDVIIVIYPLKSGLYRVQIDKKAEVPYFGPLFDGAIVSERVLPTLVKHTAINASRVHRLTIPHFKPFFQVRIDNLEKVVKECKKDTTFETFAAGVFAPRLADHDYIPAHVSEGVDSDQGLEVDAVDGTKSKEDRDDTFGPARMIRRLSMRNRKSSHKHMSTPPDSPKGSSKS